MLHTIEESIGIDAVIERVKEDLYSKLEYEFPNVDIDGFGRVYRNRKEVGLVPEFRIGKEYRDVYVDDTKDGLFAFLPAESSRTEDEWVFSNEVKILFFLNLDKFYGAYLDSKIQRDVVSMLRTISYDRYTVETVETDLRIVFRGFHTERLNHADIAPWHFFAVGVRMFFNLNDKC